jgi:hypothetical protein
LLHNQIFWTLWIATKQKRRKDDKIKRIHPKQKKKKERKGSGLRYDFKENSILISFIPSFLLLPS